VQVEPGSIPTTPRRHAPDFPNCAGRMRVIATIDDPRVVQRILTQLGLLGDSGPQPGPPTWQAT
jgi:hypothetical protein